MEGALKQVQSVIESFSGPNGRKFFQASRRGETFELKAELNGDTKYIRKDAVKKVIANMTIGKDVSMLFADVVKNMQTEDLELKKLVYLYLMNYAKSQPELVILAVNTFVKDSDDPNPLIRAMAIRTMGCLRVPKIQDYICDPLKKALKDDHPYVRKTATICVAKLHELNAQLAYDNGFIGILQDLMSDQNPMVVANAVAALLEIRENSSRKDVFLINPVLLNKLLVALNECTEWGQISILEALASYNPASNLEAESVVERVLPRLQHANASVVLSAVKVILLYLPNLSDAVGQNARKKLSPPLITLLSSPPEVQYVALKNIDLILQKRPDVLTHEINVFFCKYNDPPYVKLAKLEVMLKLASDANIEQLLSELKEYANEVDVDFVRRSVRAIGKCAIRIENASERCVGALLDLIKNKVNYVVQESIIVAKDIFRKYPNKFESVIPTLCENLESLDEPEAKAAMIWVVGEYAHKIENAGELITYFSENFKAEHSSVQLQLLTATIKLFLKKPQQGQNLVQSILQTATTTGESADLRDKAYIYWRLLSSDPAAAKAVVLAERPPIEAESTNVTPSLLNELMKQLCTIASVYHMPAKSFLTQIAEKARRDGESDDEDSGDTVNIQQAPVGDLLDLDFGGSSTGAVPPAGGASPAAAGGLVDLLGGLGMSPPQQPFGATSPPMSSSALPTSPVFTGPKQVWLTAEQAKGMQITGTFSKRGNQPHMELTVTNKALTPMSDFGIQFNKNTQGFTPGAPMQLSYALPPNQSAEFSIPLKPNPGHVQKMEPTNLLQIAVKCQLGVFYFQVLIDQNILTGGPASSAVSPVMGGMGGLGAPLSPMTSPSAPKQNSDIFDLL